jgi:hypothetical protein
MGIVIRKRARLGRSAWLNLGRSGVSASLKVGRLTLSCTGRASVRLARGVSYRTGAR